MFLNYYFACCLVIFVGIFLGTLSGSIYSYNRQGKVETSIFVGLGTFFLVICGVFGYWEYRTYDFYGYGGDFDYYRMPLDYPYELTMVDLVDCASITKWQEDNLIVTGITHYYKQDNIIVGKISARCFFPDESVWFSFDTNTGAYREFRDETVFRDVLKRRGLDETLELLTVEENWDLYWRSYYESQNK